MHNPLIVKSSKGPGEIFWAFCILPAMRGLIPVGFVCFIFLSPFNLLVAQSNRYHMQQYGTSHGINSGFVNNIFFDKEGYVWFISHSTLSQFDGKATKKFVHNEIIDYALCDEQNTIWTLTLNDNTIYKVDKLTKKFTLIADAKPDSIRFLAIIQWDDYPLILVTNTRTYIWDEKTQSFELAPFVIPGDGSRFHMQRVSCVDHIIYLPSLYGVQRFDMRTKTSIYIPFFGEYNQILAIDTNLCIVTNYSNNSSIADFRDCSKHLLNTKDLKLTPAHIPINIVGLVPKNSDEYLLGTAVGLILYNKKEQSFVKQKVYHQGVANTDFKTYNYLVQSPDSLLWSTDRVSLCAIRNERQCLGLLRNSGTDIHTTWENRVYGIAEDSEKNIWFGGTSGIKKWDKKTENVSVYNHLSDHPNQPYFQHVTSIKFLSNKLWMTVYNRGVICMDPKTLVTHPLHCPRDSIYYALFNDVNDDLIQVNRDHLLVCGRFNLTKINTQTREVSKIAIPIANQNLNSGTQDSDGNIWLGSQTHLICLDSNYQFQDAFELPDHCALSFISEYAPGKLLCGLNKGLYLFTKSAAELPRFQRIDMQEKAIVGFMGCMKDNFGRYWFSTSEGMFVTDSLFNYVNSLDNANNLQSHLFSPFSAFSSLDGTFYFGGMKGINYFTPEDFQFDNTALNFKIDALRINNDSILYPPQYQTYHLKYWQNILEFEISCPYFSNNSNLQFSYNLNGDSTQWQLLGTNNKINLNKISPGSYQLQIAATSNMQKWYVSPQLLRIIIDPPFWKTNWFMFICGIGVLGGFWYFQRRREALIHYQRSQELQFEHLKHKTLQVEMETRKQLEEKEKSILEAEKRSAQLQLANLTNHLNPHFLFNSLTSLNSLIFDDQKLASEFLKHLSKVYRYVLQNKDKETVSLKQELEFVANYIRLHNIRFGKDLQVHQYIDPTALHKGIVPVTLQILVENCIKHNIISSKQVLHIYLEADAQRICIKNNKQLKHTVETSNKQGLERLSNMYTYLTHDAVIISEDDSYFSVSIPLIPV